LLNSTEQLIDLLLKIARLDAGADELEKKEISVEECVGRALKLFAAGLEIKEISIETLFDGECFTGDMRWTAEALANIIKNCIEHTPQGGKISICACETPIFTEITVCDSGSGFDENDIAHLFERFYKGKSSDSSGFGIGLSLASIVIKRQNGSIRAYNGDSGACFEIKFYKEVI
ncbi:MAG: HAMP domain-containing histidine kinase, partial [Clostridia bacterium]|nr:HAMP domain-containing histidine kinase [Clostridia bacterium]